MLQHRRSPGPPWLPVPHFADTATLTVGPVPNVRFVAALVMLDRSFRPVSSTPWTTDGGFGLRLGAGISAVPNDAKWWVVSVGFTNSPLNMRRLNPSEVFSVRWGLHL